MDIRNHVVGSSKFYKFKLELARCLVQRTSNPTALESTNVQKESRSAKHVPDDIRLDGVGHLPKQVADITMRCKNPDCNRRTKFFCVKCKVYLCIDKHSDCFHDYHITSD